MPQEAAARAQRLRELEAHALKSGQTQILIETPYRNAALWQALLQHLKPGTALAVASGLTLPQAACRMQTVAAWKKLAPPVSTELPAVFLFGP